MSTRSADSSASIPVVATPYTSPPVSPDVLQAIARIGMTKEFPQILEVTRELFGNDFEIEVSEDPEIANYTYVTFNVKVRGTIEEVLEMDRKWCQRVPHGTIENRGAFTVGFEFQR